MKQGAIQTQFLIGLIIALVLLFIVTSASGDILGDSGIRGFFGLLPDFADVELNTDGVIVGMDLRDISTISYWDGASFVPIARDNSFTLDEYTFSSQEVREQLAPFYFVERRPETFTLEENHWLLWYVGYHSSLLPPDGLAQQQALFDPLVLHRVPKNGFTSPRSDSDVRADKTFSPFEYDYAVWDFYIPDYSITLSNIVRGIDLQESSVQTVFAWKDSILQGNSCEKFITLTINDRQERFAVQKIDSVIFVDLDRPVPNDKPEEYQDEQCFTLEEYEDINRESWNNFAQIHISILDRYLLGQNEHSFLLWKPTEGWLYRHSTEDSQPALLSNEQVPEQYRLSEHNQADFFGGLSRLIHNGISGGSAIGNDLEDEIKEITVRDISGSFVETIPTQDITVDGYLDDSFDKESELIFRILDYYNKYLQEPLPEEKEYSLVLIEEEGTTVGRLLYLGNEYVAVRIQSGIVEYGWLIASQEDAGGNRPSGTTLLNDKGSFITHGEAGTINEEGIISIDYDETSVLLPLHPHIDALQEVSLSDLIGGDIPETLFGGNE